MIKFAITNRLTGKVQFTAEIDADDSTPLSVKIGLAVRWGYETNADLSSAYLYGADLSGADLSGADLSRAYLYGADLSRADLSGADLSRADLSRAYLSRANLSRANLSSADLYGANLSSADLYGAYLPTDVAGVLALKRTRILPEGDLIGWKKCRDGVIVKLLIPEAAKRSHAWGRKCRAQFVDVLAVIGADVGISGHDGKTEYREGQRVTPHEWDDDWREECGGGIHFYITREEAEAHT